MQVKFRSGVGWYIWFEDDDTYLRPDLSRHNDTGSMTERNVGLWKTRQEAEDVLVRYIIQSNEKTKNKNLLSGMRCYECGPIDRVNWGTATQWRQDLKPFLFNLGIGVLDPCDKPCDTGVEDENLKHEVQECKNNGEWDEAIALMKPVAAIDLRMVDIADFVIMYLNLDSHMCGSYHEAFLAISQKKPLLIMCQQGKENVPNWMFGVMPHEHMFSNWYELKQYLERVNKGSEPHLNRWRFMNMAHVYGKGQI